MDNNVKLTLVICLIICIITCFVLRMLRKRLAYQMCELMASALFIAYTSQYAYLISSLGHISIGQLVQLLLFIFAVMVGVYKVLSFIFKR